MKSRIAIFEGYASPFRGASSSYGRPPKRRRSTRRMGAPIFDNPRMGAPIFDNPRMSRYADLRTLPQGYGAPIFDNPRVSGLGRGAYYVPASGRAKPYRVKAKRNTPAMKRAQARFKKAAKSCARTSKGKGKFQACMRRKLKSKSKR